MSILTKYTLAVATLLLLAAGSVTLLSLSMQRSALRAEAIKRGRTVAQNLSSGSVDAFIRNDPFTLIPLAVDTQKDNEGVLYAAVTNAQGKIVADSDNAQNGKTFALENPRNLEGDPRVQEASWDGAWVWDVSAPIIPKEKNVELGTVHVGISRQAVEDAVRKSLVRLLAASALLLMLGVILSVALVRVLVGPIRTLSDAAARIGQGELDLQVPVHSKDELGQLSATFNSMIGNLKQAEKVKLEKERIQGELNVAHSIQAGLLPGSPPKFSHVDVAFVCSPAKELGGDFFDWFALDGGAKLGLVIADVSGKGVPAALHMANLRNLMRFVVRETLDPAETLKKVNALAWPDLKGDSFVTVFYAIFDLASREIRYVSAGHEPALLHKGRDGSIVECRAKGMPVGIAEPEDFDFVIKESRVTLEPGDSFIMFTDGVTEAMNVREEQFGREGMLKVVAASKGSADLTVKAVVEAVKKHADGFDQSDDITLLMLKSV
jgi:sigma-B regulation protein RsbU (phosphoserine phosphatase)